MLKILNYSESESESDDDIKISTITTTKEKETCGDDVVVNTVVKGDDGNDKITNQNKSDFSVSSSLLYLLIHNHLCILKSKEFIFLIFEA